MTLEAGQLAALVAVIRQGSFDRAASVLHVTPSAVSQRIKQLEESIGHILVVRGMPCVATSTGERLYRHALQVELLEQDLMREARPDGAPGDLEAPPVALAVNADSLATWLVPALTRFAEATGLRVDVVLDDQDHTAQWLRSGRVIGAVTAEAVPVQGCRVETLGVMRYRAIASKAFMRRWFPKGVTAAQLRRAPALVYGPKDDLENRFVRQVLGFRDVALISHSLPSSTAFVDASLEGLGWGMNAERLVTGRLAKGRLVDLVEGTWLDVPLFWQQWRLSSPTLSSLAAALKSEAAKTLRPA
jgi:LysR family transcriptional regulator, chromosome initiation inhibitor